MIFLRNLCYALILAVPFIYLPFVLDPAHSPVYFIFCLAIFLFIVSDFRKKFHFGSNKIINYAIASYLVWSTLIFSLHPINSESTLEYFRIVFFSGSYYFFLSQSKFFKHFIVLFILLGFIYLVYGYKDYFLCYNEKELHSGLYAIRAAIGHKNLLSMFLVLTFPWLYYLSMENKSKVLKCILFIYLILTIVLIFLCQSRVGMLGVFIYFILILSIQFFRYRQLAFKIFATCLVILTISHFAFKSNSNYQHIFKRSASIFLVSKNLDENSRSVYERKVLWGKTLKLIRDYPLFGIGLGQWKLHIVGYDINETRSKFGNIIFQQPHNDFLWIAAELGIIGLVLFVFIIGISIIILFKNSSKLPLDYSLFMFLILYSIMSFFDFPKERPLFLLMLAFVLAVVSSRAGNTSSQVKKWPLLIIFFFILLFFGKRVLAENQMTQLLISRQEGKHNEIIFAANRIKSLAVNYDHTSTPLDFYLGESYFLKDNLDSSRKYFLKSIDMSPYHLYSWSNIGAVYLKSGDDLKAVYSWEKAKEISNDFSEPRLNLALYYIGKNELVEAEKQLHYKIEKEDLTRYRLIWNQIIDSFIVHTNFSDFNEKKRISLEHFKHNQRRKDWFIQTYCYDSLCFNDQINADIDYHIKMR